MLLVINHILIGKKLKIGDVEMSIKSCDITEIQKRIDNLEKAIPIAVDTSDVICFRLRIQELEWVLDLMSYK